MGRSELSHYLRRGRTECRGHKIGYADPMLDAIRRGVSREDFVKASKSKTAAAKKALAEKEEATADKFVASIVRRANGKLAIEGSFDFKEAHEIQDLCRRILDSETKVRFG